MDTEQKKQELRRIIKATETLDFPRFSSLERKREILRELRLKADAELAAVLGDRTTEEKELLWQKAEQAAKKQFGELSEKQLLNGFYLQELLHRYTELRAEEGLKESGEESE